MPNGTYGGVRGKETKVGQKNFRFPTYSIIVLITIFCDCVSVGLDLLSKDLFLKCHKDSVLM